MQYQTIPGTDLRCSIFCLGTDDFGRRKTIETAGALLDGFHAAGGNFLDTAALYPYGDCHKSEAVIGEYLQRSGKRNEWVVATKGGHPSADWTCRLTREALADDIDNSLLALKTDVIDLYLLHRDCETIPAEELMERMAELVKAGKTRYIGVSNWRGERIAAANAYAEEKGLPRIVCSQIRFSLAKTSREHYDDHTLVEMNETELAFYRESGMAVMSFSPQAKGFFAKREKGERVREQYRLRLETEENLKSYERAAALAEKKGVSVNDIVLSYITSAPFPSFPIIGCSSAEQLADSLKEKDLFLTVQEWESLGCE